MRFFACSALVYTGIQCGVDSIGVSSTGKQRQQDLTKLWIFSVAHENNRMLPSLLCLHASNISFGLSCIRQCKPMGP